MTAVEELDLTLGGLVPKRQIETTPAVQACVGLRRSYALKASVECPALFETASLTHAAVFGKPFLAIFCPFVLSNQSILNRL